MIYKQKAKSIYCYKKTKETKSGKKLVFRIDIPPMKWERDWCERYSFRIMPSFNNEMWVLCHVVSLARKLAKQHRENNGSYDRFDTYWRGSD